MLYTLNNFIIHAVRYFANAITNGRTIAKKVSKCIIGGTCFSQSFYSCTNIMTKKQVGEERVYSAYSSILLFITKEIRTGIQAGQEAEAEQRPWRDVLYWLVSLACLACSLIKPRLPAQRWSHPQGAFHP